MELVVARRATSAWCGSRSPKLTYPVLSSFFAEVRQLVEGGARKVVIDLSAVSYIDSASIGCLMDIHRLLQEKSGACPPRRAAAPGRDHDLHDRRAQDRGHPSGTRRTRCWPSRPGRATGEGRCIGCVSRTGFELGLDGDLLGVLEALYREVTLKRQLKVSFEDMMREIEGLVDQMPARRSGDATWWRASS